MNSVKIISTFIVLMFMLTACNTMEGVGRDVESVGEEIEDTANDSR